MRACVFVCVCVGVCLSVCDVLSRSKLLCFFRVFGVSLSRYVCANVSVCVFLCKIVCVKKRVSMCE